VPPVGIGVHITGRNAGAVITVDVRRDRNRCATAGRRQRDIDTRKVRLTYILDTVAINILEHITGNRALELEPDVASCTRATGRDGHRLRIITGGQRRVRRIRHIGVDITGRYAGTVIAVDIGGDRDRRSATRRRQRDIDTREIGLTHILSAIAVHVVKDVTGDGTLELEPDVARGTRATRRRTVTVCGSLPVVSVEFAGSVTSASTSPDGTPEL
jgi:hypothetical protein